MFSLVDYLSHIQLIPPFLFISSAALLRYCVAFTRYNFVLLFFLSIYLSFSFSLIFLLRFESAIVSQFFLSFLSTVNNMLSLLFFSRLADFCSAPPFPSPFVNALAPNHPISWRKTFLTLTMSILSFFLQLSLSATVAPLRFRLRQSFFSSFLLTPVWASLLRFWNR